MISDKPRRKRIPGTHDLMKQIREINDRIVQINNSINECKDKITEAIREEKEKSSKGKLIERKQALFDEIKVLINECDNIKNEKRCILPDFMKLKEELNNEKKKINLKEGVNEINRQIEVLNKKIITTRMTQQQEHQLARELMELKKKKSCSEGLQGKEKKMLIVNEQINELNKKISEKNQEITTKKNEMKKIKNDLDRLKDTKTRNPKIEENDNKITNLKKEKIELIDKKKKVQELINEKEAEYEKMLLEMEKQMELEKQRKKIKKDIFEKEKLKNEHLKKINEIDPQRFDIISNELRQVQKNNLPISLVKSLASVKLPIPKDENEVNELILRIKQEKERYEADIQESIREIQNQIKEIDIEIHQYKDELAKMPATEIRRA